jgi:hypothetical protein
VEKSDGLLASPINGNHGLGQRMPGAVLDAFFELGLVVDPAEKGLARPSA